MHPSASHAREGSAGVWLSITSARRLGLCALCALYKRTSFAGRGFILAPGRGGEAEASLLALEKTLGGSPAARALGEETLFRALGGNENAEDGGFLDLEVAWRHTPEGAFLTLAAVYDRERGELFFEIVRRDDSLGVCEHAEDFEDAYSALLEFFSDRSAGVPL